MSRNRTQSLRSSVAQQRPAPATREVGELFVNFKDKQLGVIDPSRNPVDLLGVRYFSAETSYLAGDYVQYQGRMYRAAVPVSPGPFDSSKWYFVVDQNSAGLLTTGVYISDTAPAVPFHGQLWWESDTGNTYVWYDDASSKQWVQVNILPSNMPYIFFSRADLVAKTAAGFQFVPGNIYIAPPFSYIATPGATDIPDLPGLLPYGDVHVGHFGAKADMTWAYKTFPTTTTSEMTGPYRLTGTDDRPAFIAADNYTQKIGTGWFYAEEGAYPNATPGINGGGYYLADQLILQGTVVSRREYRNYLWLHYKTIWHSGIWINSNTGGVIGFSIIDQYDQQGVPKPFAHGMMGCGITVCPSMNQGGGPTIYSTETQPIIEGITIDVKFCRAGNGSPAGLPTQPGGGAYHLFVASGAENCRFRVGTFGRTNRSSNGLAICHWGMKYTGGDPYTDFYNMQILESYHCCDCTFEQINYYDQGAGSTSKHGFSCYFENAGGGCTHWGDISVKGVYPLQVAPGDCINNWCNPRQKEKIMKGITIGFVSAVDVPLSSADGIKYENSGSANLYMRGFGTSKFNNDMYDGTTDRNRCRQLNVDIKAQGFYFRREGLLPAWNGRGLFLQGCFGKLDMGAVETYGIGRGYEIEYCDGDQSINYVQGDGCLLYEFSRGGRLNQTDTNRLVPGYIENPDDGSYRPGTGPGTRAVSIGGGSYSTLVSDQGVAGRVNTVTRTWIVPFAGPDDDVYEGTPIKIGDEWVTATDFIQGRSNGQIIVATIQGITNSNPAIVTSEGVGSLSSQVKSGMFVGLTGVQGMLVAGGPSSINGKSGTVTLIDEDHFSININTSAMTPYISGGNIIPQLQGVPYIEHTPRSTPAAQGETVYVEEFTRVKQLSLTSTGGETALRMLHASADSLDMHGLRSAYKYGALLTDARATLKGPLPTTVGAAVAVNAKAITGITKANPALVTCPNHGMTGGSTKVTITGVTGMTEINGKSATIVVFNANQFTFAVNTTSYSDYVSGGTATQTREDYTIQGDAKSLFSMSDGTILDNPKVAFHVFMTKDDVSGAMGHVDLRNCRIENISRLMVGNKSTLRYGLSMHGCVDTQKNQNLSHPGRQGLDDDQVVGGKGFYHYSEDGKLECWLRNVQTVFDPTDGGFVYNWTFPAAFNAGGDTVVAHVQQISNVLAPARKTSVITTGSSVSCKIKFYSLAQITAISKANPGVITVPGGHRLSAGQIVALSDIAGMTQMNGKSGPVTVIDGQNFSIGIDTTAFSTYAYGGLMSEATAFDIDAVGRYFDE